MDIGNITLVGVPALILIPLIVQALKTYFHVTDDAAPYWAGGLCVAAAALSQAVDAFPTLTPYVSSAVGAIVLFLMVTGLYHSVKNVAKPKDGNP